MMSSKEPSHCWMSARQMSSSQTCSVAGYGLAQVESGVGSERWACLLLSPLTALLAVSPLGV